VGVNIYRNRNIGFMLSITVGVIFTVLLLIPASDIPGPEVRGLDKVIHFAMFFVLVLPALTFAPSSWVWVVPLAIFHGGMIEIIQPYFGRGMEFGDFVANTLGVCTAIPMSRAIHRRWLKPRQISEHKRPERDD
jgi:hypothetical protein